MEEYKAAFLQIRSQLDHINSQNMFILPASLSCGRSEAAIVISGLKGLMKPTTQLHLHCRVDDILQDHLVSLTGFKWG